MHAIGVSRKREILILCEEIEDEDERNHCHATVAGDIMRCDRIKNREKREQCRREVI